MERDLPKVLGKENGGEGEGALEVTRVAFQELLKTGRELSSIATVLSQKLRPLNLDHDATGYAISGQLEANIGALQSRVVPLTPEEAAFLAASQEVNNALFADGADIFQLSHSDEWDAVERLVLRASAPEVQNQLASLGLTVMYRRLVRCHELMGVALGKKSGSTNLADLALTNFERAIKNLVAKTYAFYDQESVEHEAMQNLLLGAYEYQLGLQRQKQRRTRKEDPYK